jgi:hypothetical protein
MSGQIYFFKKNLIDLEKTDFTITVTDSVANNNGQAFINYLLNRNNYSGWATTGSTDAANTQLEIVFSDAKTVQDILLIKHSFKSYTIQYDPDGLGYHDFSTAISVSGNADENSFHTFTAVSVMKIKIIITGTIVANSDKFMRQLIVTNHQGLGQLSAFPQIKGPTLSLSKKINTMVGGKINVVESAESFSCTLTVKNWSNDADLTTLENIYFNRDGVLIWMCGNDESQFLTQRIMYRKEDIYLVRPSDEWQGEWYSGLYRSGMDISISLKEAIT